MSFTSLCDNRPQTDRTAQVKIGLELFSVQKIFYTDQRSKTIFDFWKWSKNCFLKMIFFYFFQPVAAQPVEVLWS